VARYSAPMGFPSPTRAADFRTRAGWLQLPPGHAVRLGWFGVAIVSIVFGLWSAVKYGPPWFWLGIDGARVVEAGRVWAEGGDPYSITGYFYTPAMAVVASVLPDWTPILAVAVGVAVVLVVAPRNPLAWLAVLAVPAVWIDLGLANVTVLLAGAMLLAVRRDAVAWGLPLGIALALVPKPLFAAVLLWMLVHQRRSLTGVVVGGLVVTLPALATGRYDEFAMSLLRGIDPRFEGNLGLSSIAPILGPIASVAAIVVTLILIRRREASLMAAGIAGSFIGSYIGSYAPVLALAILPRYARYAPGAALAIAWVGLAASLYLPVVGTLAFAIVGVHELRNGSMTPDALRDPALRLRTTAEAGSIPGAAGRP
jgi:hypothetical protein